MLLVLLLLLLLLLLSLLLLVLFGLLPMLNMTKQELHREATAAADERRMCLDGKPIAARRRRDLKHTTSYCVLCSKCCATAKAWIAAKPKTLAGL
jgi:hypothetical protein